MFTSSAVKQYHVIFSARLLHGVLSWPGVFGPSFEQIASIALTNRANVSPNTVQSVGLWVYRLGNISSAGAFRSD